MEGVRALTKAISHEITGFEYEARLSKDISFLWEDIGERICNFQNAKHFEIVRVLEGGKTTNKDAKAFVKEIILKPAEFTISISVFYSQAGSIKPIEVLTQVLNINEEVAREAELTKVKTFFR